MEPYEKAYEQERISQDRLQHAWWGSYGISATLVAVEHAIFGKKAQSKYIEETIYDREKSNRELTEEEKQMELENFLAKNARMREKWKHGKRK